MTVEYSPPGQGLVSSSQAKFDVREVPDESEELECGLSVQRLKGASYEVTYSWVNGTTHGPHILDFGTPDMAPLVMEGSEGSGTMTVGYPFVSRMMYKNQLVVLGYPDQYKICEFAVVMPDSLKWETHIPLAVASD